MRITNLRLHHFAGSRSARVLWALHEVSEAPFDVVPVDLYSGDQYKDEFLRLNPNHAVPALDVAWSDGTRRTIVESAAIVAFLGDAFPDKGLAPPPGPSPARADYLQMLVFAAAHIDMALWQIRVQEHVLGPDERDEATIARYRRKMREEMEPQLLARIGAGGFVCGPAFTLADCVVGHIVTWARGYGLAQQDEFRAYLSRLSKRRAFLKAFADAREFTLAPPENSALRAKFTG